MPPRTLASLAHALAAASDLDAAIVALGEALAEVDRSTELSLFGYDVRHQMLRERVSPDGSKVLRARADTTVDHLPARIRTQILAGGQFVDLGEQSDEYARLLGLDTTLEVVGLLVLCGLCVVGLLSVVVVVFVLC